MIALLPAELRPLFEKQKARLIERCVDPDLWRIVGWDAEDPNHFVDLDYFGEYPVHGAAARVRPRGAEVRPGRRSTSRGCCRGGRQSSTAGCSATFESARSANRRRRYTLDNIVLFSAILAHYVEDGHVPLHAVVNYDGLQDQSARRCTGRWEGELFERNRAPLQRCAGAAEAR